jgi:S1-C subfamily serine protease
VVRVTATDPAGWYCQLETSGGGRTTALTRIVSTSTGVFASAWLVPRTTTVRTWTLRLTCGTSIVNVRRGHGISAHQVRKVLPPVPPSRVTPDLVDVTSEIGYQSGSIAAGTGIVLGPSGLVVTNNHVIVGATSITAVDLSNRHTYAVRVVGVDVSHDLAVLQLVGAHGLRHAPFGDSSMVVRGSGVSTVGNVGGAGGRPTITSGIITAVDQSVVAVDSSSNLEEHLSGLFETNALMQPGDSGGPLVDALGDVIGIDTAALNNISPSAATNEGFAIPISAALMTARAIIHGQASPELAIGSHAYTAYLGVQVIPAMSGTRHVGVRVVQVLRRSPAARAGLKAKDIITAINTDPTAHPPVPTHKITTPTQLATILNDLHPGASVALTWTGKSAPVTPTLVRLGTGPAR